MVDLKSITEDIVNIINDFTLNNEKALKGNKAAATRARKASLEAEKKFKEYRKISLSSFSKSND